MDQIIARTSNTKISRSIKYINITQVKTRKTRNKYGAIQRWNPTNLKISEQKYR